MADDDIDVEGEFDMKTELGDEFYDTNELPSKSANLLPEFTSPAWMLEQGWSLDSCMDEKSKATIEKMLLEEQQYMYGRKSSRYLSIKKNVLLVTSSKTKTTTPNKTPWTQEEKNTFLQGMGIFGRSWSKIANLIPSRTSLQVKNYAQQYMKNLAKKKADMERTEMETFKSIAETPLYTTNSSALVAAVASVTTSQPTIPVATTSSNKLSSAFPFAPETVINITRKTKPKVAKASNKDIAPQKINASKKQATKKSKVLSSSRSPRKKLKSRSLPSNGIIAYGDITETSDVKQEANLITFENAKTRNRASRSESICSTSDGHSIINGSTDGSNLSFPKEEKLSDMEDEDIEVDIDIENDDDDENHVLQSRSASPSSVYELLLKSAHVVNDSLNKEVSSSSGQAQDGSSTQMEDQTAVVTLARVSPPNVDIGIEDIKAETNSADTLAKDIVSQERNTTEEEEIDHHVKTETIVNGLVGANREVIEFDIPLKERVFPPNHISEEEKGIHADFFDGRPPKTPERYLRIRNYIIDCWLKCKPGYLNKTCIRSGLKNCGDVNCIGRIHSYLECVGAINFSCEQAAYRNPHKAVGAGGANSRVKGMNKELLTSLPLTKSESARLRKKRRRDGTGLWVDVKELEGKTIEHKNEIKKSDANHKAKTPRSAKSVYDPFKLVPCHPFSEDYKAPYKIEMFSTALATMDIHAHISKTEVIGMLGGQFNSQTSCLVISMAVPCKSMSTGMQCEMDPVSQTLASEQIEDVGMSVVGWYHSHPTFGSNPSVRDIETQQKFQYWFSKGGSHFVGVIISPYNASSSSVFSDIQCLTISDVHSKDFLANLPYKFEYKVVYRDNLREILGPASELAEKYSNYVNRVILSCQYRSSLGITCLSKMLQSVKRLLVPNEDEQADSTNSSTGTSVSDSLSQQETDTAITQHKKTDTSSDSLQAGPSSCALASPLPLTVSNTWSKSKIDEVLHWLEQIFLEKFSLASPRSPSMDNLL